MTIFDLHSTVLADYRDFVRSFLLIADERVWNAAVLEGVIETRVVDGGCRSHPGAFWEGGHPAGQPAHRAISTMIIASGPIGSPMPHTRSSCAVTSASIINHGRRFVMLATFALWLVWLSAVASMAEGATHGDIVQASFQQLLDQWGYHEWWSMWEQGTSRSRSAISKDAFANRMEASPWRLACCDKHLRNLQIRQISSEHVVVTATLLFETKGSPRSVRERPYPLNLNYYLEDQEWRVDLSGLSQP